MKLDLRYFTNDGWVTNFGILITKTETIIMPICKFFLEICRVLSRCYTCICLLYGASSFMFSKYNVSLMQWDCVRSKIESVLPIRLPFFLLMLLIMYIEFIVGSLVAFPAFCSFYAIFFLFWWQVRAALWKKSLMQRPLQMQYTRTRQASSFL